MPASTRALRTAFASLLLALPLLARALTYHVTLDTSPLASVAGYIAFDLVAGDGAASNTAVLGSFLSTAALSAASSSGNVVGTLPGPVTLASTSFFNEYLQGVTFAAGTTTFDLTVSTKYTAGAIPDQFSLFLLDSTYAPFATSDPTGAGALIVIDLVNVPAPQVYTSPFAGATLVPEPGAGAMLLAGLAALAGLRRAFKRF